MPFCHWERISIFLFLGTAIYKNHCKSYLKVGGSAYLKLKLRVQQLSEVWAGGCGRTDKESQRKTQGAVNIHEGDWTFTPP